MSRRDESRDKIGIRELKNRASKLVREIREQEAEYVITLRGEPVAVLRPFTSEDEKRLRRRNAENERARIESLADRIAAAWSSSESAADLLEEQRR